MVDTCVLIIVGTLCVLLICPLASRADGALEGQVITVVFRYDDYSNQSQTEIEERLIGAFHGFGLPCTFAIIPYVGVGDWRDPDLEEVEALGEQKAAILRRAIASGTVEPALHGHSHITIRDCHRGGCSEFAGLGYHSQMAKLLDGKILLERRLGTAITIFVPPWNSYDLDTLRAAEDLGFASVSAGPRGAVSISSSLNLLPATCSLPQLQQAVQLARRSSDPDPTIVVLLHGYEFREVDGQGQFTFDSFIDSLAWIASQEDIRVSSMAELTEQRGFGAGLFRANRGCYAANAFLPPPLRPSVGSSLVYFSPQSVSGMRLRTWRAVVILACSTWLISTCAAFLVGTVLFRRFAPLESSLKYCALSLLAFVAIYVVHDLSVFYGGLLALAVALGVCAGVWGASIDRGRCCRELCGRWIGDRLGPITDRRDRVPTLESLASEPPRKFERFLKGRT